MAQTAPARETQAAETDDAVMARIAGRDSLAFSRVVEAQVGMLHRVAYRMLGDGAEAEDVAQETLLRLWASADRWRPGQAGIAAWLTRVAVNLCLDRLRRRRFSSDAEVPDRPDASPGAEEGLDAARMRAA